MSGRVSVGPILTGRLPLESHTAGKGQPSKHPTIRRGAQSRTREVSGSALWRYRTIDGGCNEPTWTLGLALTTPP